MTGLRLALTLAELRLRLLRNGVRADRGKATAVLAGGACTVLATGWILAGLVRLAGDVPGSAGPVTVVVGLTSTLVCLLGALLLAGGDDLAPRRLALLPVPDHRMAAALLLSSFVGILPVATVLVGLSTAVTWTGLGAPVALALPAAVCAALTPVVLSRALAVLLARLVTSRYARAAALATLIGAAPAVIGLDRVWVYVQARPFGVDALDALSWLPPLSAWGVGWAAAEGRTGVALARLGLSVAVLALAVLAHRHWTARWLRRSTTPARATGPALGQLQPRGHYAAVTARRLCYWYRDPRHLVEAGTALVSSALLAGLAIAGQFPDWLAGSGIALIAYTVGAPMINETALDAAGLRAGWLAGLSGTADRLCRTAAHLVWSLPCTVLASTALALAFADRGLSVPVALGQGIAVLLVTVGVGALTSVLIPWPVPPDTDSPFSGGSGAGFATLLSHLVALPATGLACWPFLALPLRDSPPWAQAAVLVTGPLYGLLVLGLLAWVAGRYVDRRGPELLLALQRPG